MATPPEVRKTSVMEDDTPSVATPPITPDEKPAQSIQGWRLIVVESCLFLGLLLSVMESSIVATSLIDIARSFDDFIRIQWVVLAYLLTYMGFALLFSRVSDVIGRKWTTFAAFSIFSAFSLGCGLAQTLDQLIAFRALQGIGGSGLYSMTMTVVPEITPKHRFGMISGVIGMTFALSSILGPILGGVISTQSTWRWIFLLNVPVGVVALVLILFAWPTVTSAGKIPLKHLDFVGAILYLVASVFFVFALQEGGSGVYAWNSPTIIAILVVGLCCGLIFAVWIWFASKHSKSISPIFPSHFFTHRVRFIIILQVERHNPLSILY